MSNLVQYSRLLVACCPTAIACQMSKTIKHWLLHILIAVGKHQVMLPKPDQHRMLALLTVEFWPLYSKHCPILDDVMKFSCSRKRFFLWRKENLPAVSNPLTANACHLSNTDSYCMLAVRHCQMLPATCWVLPEMACRIVGCHIVMLHWRMFMGRLPVLRIFTFRIGGEFWE